jgi:hypothetical protein
MDLGGQAIDVLHATQTHTLQENLAVLHAFYTIMQLLNHNFLFSIARK